MSNVLDHEKQQQILALGRLGWTLRSIEEATGIRRETVSGYLRAAGVAVRIRRRRISFRTIICRLLAFTATDVSRRSTRHGAAKYQ
jgi:hypothetical protein